MSGIGDFLREIRGDDSLREAAKRTGLSHNYISIVERGVDPRSGSPIKPSPETLRAYEKGYHCNYEELMRVAGYLSDSGEVNDTRDEAERLIEYLELDLTDEEIKKRMRFKVDDQILSDEEKDEFISFVRRESAKKKRQPASVSEPRELGHE